MKIAFLTPSLSRTAGGIFEIERRLAQSLAELPDTALEVFGLEDEHTRSDLPLWQPLRPQVCQSHGPQNFRYSRQLYRAFMKCDADIAHLHALWMHTSVIASTWARKNKRPYVVTANGMLEPWALKNASIKKKIVGILYERRCLENAACIQVNSYRELASVRDFGLRNPVCIIPNGVDTGSRREKIAPPWNSDVPPGAEVLLYLGRLHPKKNVPALLQAWKRADENPLSKNWHLVVAGWDQLGHTLELKGLAAQLDLKRVHFFGPQFGDDKISVFQCASAIVLPSLSEGLPMAVLEAWSAAKPVLMTAECNLPEGFLASAAWQIETDADGMVTGLNKLFSMSTADRENMGKRGLALVEKDFTWRGVARQLREVYEWAVGHGPSPPCLVED